MSKLTAEEKRTRKFAWLFFLTGCAIVAALQFTVGLYFTRHYFVAHFLLGLFLPFVFYGMAGNGGTFWTGIVLTSGWHYCYEFWEDQLTRPVYSPDWDQIIAGTVGLAAAVVVYRAWNARLVTARS